MSETPFSKLKPAEKFLRKWQELGYPESDLKSEFQFHPSRNWRLDFAWPSCRVGVEIHGFGYGHQAQQHLAADCEKVRGAIEVGWLIVPFTSRCLGSHERCEDAVEYVCHLLSRRHGRVEFHAGQGR